jgi:hypothetical protein
MRLGTLGLIDFIGGALTFQGCTQLTTAVNPATVDDKPSTLWVQLSRYGKPLPEKQVVFKLINLENCGTLGAEEAKTDASGKATTTFTAAEGVQDCLARVRVAAEGQEKEVAIKVRPKASSVGRIDGVSALALVLIASFAIDRITRGFLFLLSFSRRWAARFPDAESHAPEGLKKRSRLLYLALAAVLSTIVLAWYGKIRIFAAMGFTAIDPLLDALLTGLVLVGGADRTEALLKSFGSGDASASAQTPLHVTGTLTLVEREPGATAGSPSSPPSGEP